jgi:protocatechuate 3,4-dioxygenase beta subunit
MLKRLFAVAASCAVWRATRPRAQGLGEFAAGPPPCAPDEKVTPATPEGPEFKRGAPQRTSLIEPGMTGMKLVLTGTVSGLTCGPIKGARLDFWQADARGAYDQAGFRLRGHQFTEATGAYRLETVVPGPHDKRAPRLHVKVQPPGKPPLTTQLFLPDQPLNKTDPQFRPELAMTVTDGRGIKTARFNIVLNL